MFSIKIAHHEEGRFFEKNATVFRAQFPTSEAANLLPISRFFGFLGFVFKKPQGQLPEIFYTIDSIDTLDYDFLAKLRDDLLDLKPVSYFESFLKTL